MLEERLVYLKKRLVEHAHLVESMIEMSTRGLLNKDANILRNVISTYEPKSNRFEIELDELCMNLVAQYQPKAKDLRTILMAMKMNNDLERVGDLAVNISKRSLFLLERPQIEQLKYIPRLVEEATKMLRDSVASFIEEDTQKAKLVCERDSVVNDLRDAIMKAVLKQMKENPEAAEELFYLILLSRNLERVADLSTNICEDIIYMVEGRVIKHHNEDSKENETN